MTRIVADFPKVLRWLPPPSERNLDLLARCIAGKRTEDIAAEFGISRARVAQLVVKYRVPRFRLVSTVPPKPTAEERRLARIARFHANYVRSDGCWEWQGRRLPNGYGYASVLKKNEGAHRTAWRLAYGEIPAGMFVCHHCDNPPCVRPDHLFLGTPSENTLDAVAKGRWRAGGKKGPRGLRKIQAADVAAIRTRRANGEAIPSIARAFGISNSMAYEVATARRNYANY